MPTVGITEAISSMVGWVTDVIAVLTAPPLVYFLGAAIVSAAIGIFSRAKRAAM
ncbi:MAG: hypothetical protein LBC96_04565 [Lachnospiraceae bacterium]|nr:hypothetical protein [Lachnospiraceae bacterium]